MRNLFPLISFSAAALFALTLQGIMEAARAKSPEFKELLTKSFPNLKNGTAIVWGGQDFPFIAETDKEPSLSVDHWTYLYRAVDFTGLWVVKTPSAACVPGYE